MREQRDMDHLIYVGDERAKLLETIGTPVMVSLDDGRVLRSQTISQPWQLGHGQWVIKVEGISGGYDIMRVSPITEEEAA